MLVSDSLECVKYSWCGKARLSASKSPRTLSQVSHPTLGFSAELFAVLDEHACSVPSE